MVFSQPRPQVTQPDDPSIKLIPLTQGQVAIVDADRYEWAMQWNWYAHYEPCTRTYYAIRNGRRGEPEKVYLHRQILGEPDSQVDHVNHDSLDNRKANLRPCTRSQNQANRRPRKNASGNTGVYWAGKAWEARISFGRKNIYLGHFNTKEAAVAARKAAEPQYHGAFAFSARPANQPPKKPPVTDGGAAYMSASGELVS